MGSLDDLGADGQTGHMMVVGAGWVGINDGVG